MAKKMKDSGIEWIGEIPQNWTTIKIKPLIENIKSEKNKTENVQVLSLSINGVKVKKNIKEGMNPETYIGHQLVDEGDLVICLRDLDGPLLSGVSNHKGCISNLYYVLNFKDSNKYFLNYSFHSMDYTGVLDGYSYGMRHSYNISQFGCLRIPYINKDEQEKIANYLDEKVSKIDDIISKTKETIDEYKEYKKSIITEVVTKGLDKDVKMKYSGVEWIGEIPEHWEIIKGKNTLKLLSRAVSKNDEVITCFRDGEVTLRKNRREKGFTYSEKEIGYQGIEPNDLVIHSMDGFAGAIGISDSKGKASPVLVVCDTNENKEFIMYYLRSMAYNNVFTALSTGIRVRSCDLKWSKIANLFYLKPKVSEQIEIVDYIKDKSSKIDKLITEKEALILELEKYKKSLIYECVTGKKEIV